MSMVMSTFSLTHKQARNLYFPLYVYESEYNYLHSFVFQFCFPAHVYGVNTPLASSNQVNFPMGNLVLDNIYN